MTDTTTGDGWAVGSIDAWATGRASARCARSSA